MLVSMVGLMQKARQEGYCIPAPAVENEHTVRACIAAAEAKNSPLILISLFKVNPDIMMFGRIITDIALRTRVPIAICQDHGATYEEAVWAIRAGYTDIMVDRSSLPYEENVAQVKELVKIAHAVGVGVEAELGHVGTNSDGPDDSGEGTGSSVFTVPAEAASFVAETGVDTLAVSIGTAHGPYKGTPKLQFDLLRQLRETVPVPLVLHGGSGTGDENLSRACKMGICKLNISNDLKRGAIAALTAQDNLMGMGAYKMYPLLAQGYTQTLEHYIDICGSAGKA
ncbi:class II fructose-bisphosphate aldolase [Pseudoflavonifractor sp. CLA-AP-H29]|uniref:Class II fructose-bisphosphate aldolase n=1 Tax=Pseudoflavonifractor intestinihominis TaxID=3133171 RepID=A0ABV1E702_9FIRM